MCCWYDVCMYVCWLLVYLLALVYSVCLLKKIRALSCVLPVVGNHAGCRLIKITTAHNYRQAWMQCEKVRLGAMFGVPDSPARTPPSLAYGTGD